MKTLVIFLLLFSINIVAEPVSVFNSIIQKNLTFNQKVINNNKIEEMIGDLVHEKKIIKINVTHPYRETYVINNSKIIIYDYDFDQSRAIDIKDLEMPLVLLFKNGVQSFENIKNISKNSFEIHNKSVDIYVEILNEESFFVKYKDNLDFINLINFKVT